MIERVAAAGPRNRVRYIECGVIEPKRSGALAARLGEISLGLAEIIDELAPRRRRRRRRVPRRQRALGAAARPLARRRARRRRRARAQRVRVRAGDGEARRRRQRRRRPRSRCRRWCARCAASSARPSSTRPTRSPSPSATPSAPRRAGGTVARPMIAHAPRRARREGHRPRARRRRRRRLSRRRLAQHAGRAAVGGQTWRTLHTELIVREDSLSLVGFATVDERAAFDLVTGVQGIGPKLAMSILSTLEAGDAGARRARRRPRAPDAHSRHRQEDRRATGARAARQVRRRSRRATPKVGGSQRGAARRWSTSATSRPRPSAPPADAQKSHPGAGVAELVKAALRTLAE